MAVSARGGSIVPISDLDLQPLDVAIPGTAGANALSIERVKHAALVSTVVKGTNTMWANVWGCSPVTAALTMRILPLARKATETGRVECVELACGCAIPSLAAARAGARVLATDVTSMALLLLEHNATRNGIPTSSNTTVPTTASGDGAPSSSSTAAVSASSGSGVLETAFVNVSDEPEAMLESLGARGWSATDMVVASEVMFLSSMQRPVARTSAALLRPGGLGLVVDAMRPSCEGFQDKCEDSGLGSALVESGPIASNGIVLPGCRVFILFPLVANGTGASTAAAAAAAAAGTAALDLSRVRVTGCAPDRVPANAIAAVAEVTGLLDTLQEEAAAAPEGSKKGYCV